tara:strand:+ start:210 stop:500 length:291 start_codon:yes stop_codon:yes gene_type:complete
MMIGVLVKLNIKEGSEKDFEENMLKLVEATNANEPGVFYYGLLKTDDPQTYQMIEIYKDAESHANHSQTEHFKTLGGALAPFLAGAPEISVHEEIK